MSGIGRKPGARLKPLVELGAEPDDCWTWIGSISSKTGYGKKQWHGKTLLAHRWVWEIFFGPIAAHKVINHKCSNRSCVNPHHLDVVSQSENCRHGKGGKLTETTVKALRRRLPIQRGERKRIAAQVGISESHLNAVLRGDVWPEV